MASFESRNSFEHIDKFSYEIGPRPAGTERSRKAAEYIKKQFDGCGLKTRFQNFEFVDKIIQTRARTTFLAGIFLLAPFLSFYLSWLVLFLVVAGGYGFSYLFPRFMPKENARNVVGTLKPEGVVEERAVVGAHYDSAPCTKGREWTLFFRAAFPALLAAFLILSICRFFVGGDAWLMAWAVLAVPYLFTCALPYWLYEDQVSPGANDNASGVSVVLEAARVASESPPEETEIRFVAFGGEEQGLVGSEEFSKRTATPDFFLNLDSLGSGNRPSVIQGNGVFRRHRTSSRLNKRIDEESEVEKVWAPFSGHDHIPFIKEGMEATTLSSIESYEANKLDRFLEKFFGLPYVRTHRHSKLHTLGDVPERIELVNIERSGHIALNLLGIGEK